MYIRIYMSWVRNCIWRY